MVRRVERLLEAAAVFALAAALAYLYSVSLGGLPYELLVTVFEASKLGSASWPMQAWTEAGLGSPNAGLPFTTTYLLLSLLESIGLKMVDVGLVFLTILWVSGGYALYSLTRGVTGSRLAGLMALVIYLGANASVRGPWSGFGSMLLYTLTPIALLFAGRGFERRSLSYGFYTALTATVLAGGIVRVDYLTALTLTVLAYLIVRSRGEADGFKRMVLFTAFTGVSWVLMSAWWIAIPPGLETGRLDPWCLSTLPLSLLTLLAACEIDRLNGLKASATLFAAILLMMNPREIVTSNAPPEVLAVLAVNLSILAASSLKRVTHGLGKYLSISLIVENRKGGEREYDLLKPAIYLLIAGLIVYQSLAAPLIWRSSLTIPEYCLELNSFLPEADYRVLALPVVCGDAYYSWSFDGYENGVDRLILDRPVVSGCEFLSLNKLLARRGFWKILSALGVKYVVLHMDINPEKSMCVNPERLEKMLNYSLLTRPNIENGLVNLSAADMVKPLMERFGFVQLVNYNPSKPHRVEARPVDMEEAQSSIHIHAFGEAWISENPNLNETFSFAYVLPRKSSWMSYAFLEFWINVNGSDEVAVRLYDVYGRWAVWNVRVGERLWSLRVLQLNNASLDNGLDRSAVSMLVFSIKAPLGRFVEAKVGGIFLDKGVARETKPLDVFKKYEGLAIVYKLRDEFDLPKIYAVNYSLRRDGGDILESFLSESFKPSSSAYVDDHCLNISQVEVSYVKEGPSRYTVTVSRLRGRFLLVLNERFNHGWSLYLGRPNLIEILLGAEPVNVKHVKVNGFFNGWYVEAVGEGELKLTMLYRPQVWLEALTALSLSFTLLGFIIIIVKRHAGLECFKPPNLFTWVKHISLPTLWCLEGYEGGLCCDTLRWGRQ